jgi:hypothetical protein
MVALNDAQTAAMLAFLKTRRGDKELKPDELVEAMLRYMKAKGIPVNELETLAPGASDEDRQDFIQQWREYAIAAGVDDVPSINLVVDFQAGRAQPAFSKEWEARRHC